MVYFKSINQSIKQNNIYIRPDINVNKDNSFGLLYSIKASKQNNVEEAEYTSVHFCFWLSTLQLTKM